MAEMGSTQTMITEINRLKREIFGLFEYMQRVRQEIAAIHKPADQADNLFSMEDQLDAIVSATEQATDTIMESIEKNNDLVEKLRARVGDDPEALALIDKMVDNGMLVFEACSFQDITGQRISKVVKSMKYVETRVNAIIEIWGKKAVEMTPVSVPTKREGDKVLLNGPQLEGGGISQEEIDKLFE